MSRYSYACWCTSALHPDPTGLRACCHPCRRTATGLVFSEDFAEDAPRIRALLVGLAHVMGAGGERLPERPAAPTRPGGLADGQPIPERVTAVGGEQRPGDSQVAGRIADAARPEVDDGRQPPIDEQEIPRGDVTVEPVRDPIPARPGQQPRSPGLGRRRRGPPMP